MNACTRPGSRHSSHPAGPYFNAPRRESTITCNSRQRKKSVDLYMNWADNALLQQWRPAVKSMSRKNPGSLTPDRKLAGIDLCPGALRKDLHCVSDGSRDPRCRLASAYWRGLFVMPGT